MNYKKVFETIVVETQKYLESNNIESMILGISGGLDSTVTAAVCSEVEKRNPNIKFYGVSLPCSSNTNEENDVASLCMKGFCKPSQYWVENLQKEYMLMKATCSQHHLPTTIGQGNIKARLRMLYLYDLANYTNGIVMDTDNLTEHYLGFFTIHGDVGDFNPIGGLWKHEVYELAKYLLYDYYNTKDITDSLSYQQMALKGAIGITPTDGNGVNNYGDMGQIAPAFIHNNNIDAYKNVDAIINAYLNMKDKPSDELQAIICELERQYNVNTDTEKYDTVGDIISRIKRTEYKRNKLPIRVDRSLYLS